MLYLVQIVLNYESADWVSVLNESIFSNINVNVSLPHAPKVLGRIKARALCFSFLSCNEMLHQRFEVGRFFKVKVTHGFIPLMLLVQTEWEKKSRVAVLSLFWKMPGINSSCSIWFCETNHICMLETQILSNIGYCNNTVITHFMSHLEFVIQQLSTRGQCPIWIV